MTRVNYDGLIFQWPEGWFDVTADLDPGAPLTLGRPSGPGAIQFSSVEYAGGQLPDITVDDLLSLLEPFCLQNGLNIASIGIQRALTTCVETHGRGSDGSFLAAWYLSNGKDVIFVTYVSTLPESDQTQIEHNDARALVGTIEYRPNGYA
jgi:hypothetical protein